jgi:hypothetical protein
MASLETIGPLMNGMRKRADTVGLACEAINRMFQKEQSELVAQVSDSVNSVRKTDIPDGQTFCMGGLRTWWTLRYSLFTQKG